MTHQTYKYVGDHGDNAMSATVSLITELLEEMVEVEHISVDEAYARFIKTQVYRALAIPDSLYLDYSPRDLYRVYYAELNNIETYD
jgi:hypothetical protein